MKFNKLTKLLSLCLLLTLITSSTAFASTEVSTTKPTKYTNEATINLNDYPRDSRERFVASLALKHNISYEEADILERQETSAILMLRGSDEVLKYKTVDKSAGTIYGNSYSQSVYIATEVRYVWNRATNTLTNIEAIGGPLTYLPGISSGGLSMSGGDYNIEKYSKTARISQTVAFTYEITGTTVQVGGDILSVSRTTSGYKITTSAKTYAISISASDLG